jgi:multiple sugar transport system substrate-binding protein
MSTETRISRRTLLKRACMLGAGLTLAACAPKVVQQTVVVEKVVEKNVTSVPAAPGEIVIQILCRAEYGGDPVRLYAQKFETAYPGLRAKTVDVAYAEHLKKIQAMYAAGNCPDVIYTMVKYGPYLTQQGIHMPLNDLIDAGRTEYKIDDFYPSALKALMFEGKQYALPEWSSPTSRPLVVYNADMFKAAGIPTPPMEEWDVNAWKDAAIKLTKPDKGIFGMIPPSLVNYYDWDAFVDGFGGHILTNEVGLAKKMDFVDNAKNKEAWAWYSDVAIKNHATPRRGETPQNVNMFTAGLVATTVDGLYHLPGLPKEVGDKFKYGITLMKGPVRKGAGMFIQGFGLTTQTKHPQEAFKLAYYQTSTEVGVWSATTGVGMGLQGRRSQWNDKSVLAAYPIYGVLAKWWEDDIAPFPQPWNLRYQELYDVYAAQTDKLYYGEVTWDAQAPVVQQKSQEIMDQARP